MGREATPTGEETIKGSAIARLRAQYSAKPFAADVPEWEKNEYVRTVMEEFEQNGILKLMERRPVKIIMSSVGVGEREPAFVKALDEMLGRNNGKVHKPTIFFTDFATREGEGNKPPKSIMRWPKPLPKNVDLKLVAGDMARIPLPDNSVDVLCERLGGLWHAAEVDQRYSRGKKKESCTRAMLAEYQRVIRPGGIILLDSRTSDSPRVPPTLAKIRSLTNGAPQELLEEFGFGVRCAEGKPPQTESFATFTKPEGGKT